MMHRRLFRPSQVARAASSTVPLIQTFTSPSAPRTYRHRRTSGFSMTTYSVDAWHDPVFDAQDVEIAQTYYPPGTFRFVGKNVGTSLAPAADDAAEALASPPPKRPELVEVFKAQTARIFGLETALDPLTGTYSVLPDPDPHRWDFRVALDGEGFQCAVPKMAADVGPDDWMPRHPEYLPEAMASVEGGPSEGFVGKEEERAWRAGWRAGEMLGGEEAKTGVQVVREKMEEGLEAVGKAKKVIREEMEAKAKAGEDEEAKAVEAGEGTGRSPRVTASLRLSSGGARSVEKSPDQKEGGKRKKGPPPQRWAVM